MHQNINLYLCLLESHISLSNSLNFGLWLLIIGGYALQVSVRFFTSLRELTGKKEETLKFRDSETITVDKVLKTLAKRYGKSFVEYVYDGKTGEVKSFLQFLVNGRSASTLNGLDTTLSDGDVLAIIPPVGGG
jgi:molybdopterin synthase sulfur carrier subunit